MTIAVEERWAIASINHVYLVALSIRTQVPDPSGLGGVLHVYNKLIELYHRNLSSITKSLVSGFGAGVFNGVKH